MSRGFPSMTALLGVLAVAGYQNRDKLAEMLGGLTSGSGQTPSTQGQPAGFGTTAASSSIGSVLTNGIKDLVDRFRQAGHGEVADSWVAHGPNREVTPQNVEGAIGADTLDALTKQTGLSREEIISRLARELPNAVDKYTPDGRLPAANELPRTA